MIDFKIKRGLSTDLYVEPGVINPRLIIEAGCWYLCTDTAELFLGVYDKDENGQEFLTLKQINGTHEGGSAEVDLTGYAKLTDIPDVSKFITNAEVMALIPEVPTKVSELENDAGYITAEDIPETDLSNYYNKEEVDGLIRGVEHPTVDLTDYATKEYVAEAVGGIDIPDVSGFIKEIPPEYITETELEAKKYLTEHQDISGKADKEHSHSYNDLTDTPVIPSLDGYAKKDELFSKDYNDLTNKPELFSGSYNDLTDKPEHFDGDYNSLTNKPEIPSIEGLAKETFVTEEIKKIEIPDAYDDSEIRELINSKAASDHGHEDYALAEHAHDEYLTEQSLGDYAKRYELFSQDYNDLTNKPEIPSIAGLATEEFVNQKIAEAELADKEVDLGAYYTKSEVDGLIPDVSGFIKEVPSEYITEAELATELAKIEIPEAYNDSELRTLINSKAASDHNHDEYALVEHTHDEYLTELSLSDYAKKSDLFSKSYNDLTDTPIIPSTDGLATEKYVDDAIAGINIPEVPDVSNFITMEAVEAKGYITAVPSEYVTETELTDKGYLTEHQDLSNYATKAFVDENYYDKAEVGPFITKVETLETFKTDVTTNYATKQYVADAIETHEGIAKKAEVEEVKTKLETEVLPVVTEIIPLKANDVPFTDSKVAVNSLGGIQAGFDLKGLTIAEIFAKLLGFTVEPEENPDEPEVPDSIVDTIIETSTPMYGIDAAGRVVEVPYKLLSYTEAEVSEEPVESGFYQVIDSQGNVIESGYQQLSAVYTDAPYTIALPNYIDCNANVEFKVYNDDDKVWETKNAQFSSDVALFTSIMGQSPYDLHPEVNAETHTIWFDPETASTGAIYRFKIIE